MTNSSRGRVRRPGWILPGILALLACTFVAGMAAQRAEPVEAANNFGNPVNVNYAIYDIASDFLVADLNDPAPHAGTVDSFRIRRQAGGAGQTVRFVILDSLLKVKWVSGVFIVPAGPDDAVRFDIPGGVAVAAGDFIGMYFPGVGAVPFDYPVGGAASSFSTIPLGGPPAVGFDLLANQHAASPQARVYGIRAVYGCGAICYVNGTTGNDATNHGTSPADAFATIQAAVDSVQVGGTVIVAAGSYLEEVNITRPVTLQGPNVGKKGNDVTRVGEAVVTSFGDTFEVEDTSNVTIDGFAMTGIGQDGVWAHDSTNVVVKNNVISAWGQHGVGFELGSAFGVNGGRIERNLFTGAAPANNRNAILVTSSSGIVIDDNEVNTYLADEVIVLVGVTTSSIARNLIAGNNCGIALSTCLATVLLDFVNTVTVSENDITASPYDGGTVILVRAASQSVTIRNNILRSSAGLLVSVPTAAVNSDIVVTLNDLSNAAVGALGVGLGGSTNTVFAEKNWWGSNTGPGGIGPGSGTSIFSAGPAVDFDPWLCHGTDTSPAIGFQPLSTIALAHYSPCDTTPPVWSVSFKKHAMAPGSYVPGTPGAWSNKIVYMEFTCADAGANQSGIGQKQGDLSVTFNDGTYGSGNIPWAEGTMKGDAVGELCVDKAGNVAVPIDPLGVNSIRVDTKAPVCKPSPTTTWVPKGVVTALVSVDIDGTDATSGVAFFTGSITPSGGASYAGSFISGVAPNVLVNLSSVSMPNNTAGKLTLAITIFDNAGNSAKCSTFYIRGN